MSSLFYVKTDGTFKAALGAYSKSGGKWGQILQAYQNTPIEYLKIFIINDLHFRANTDGDPNSIGGKQESNNRYYYASPNNLRDFVAKANAEKPDLILLLGDICDTPSDFDLFNDIWNEIDLTIRKEITIGNHDFDDLDYTQLSSVLGYNTKPFNAGSQFNQSFTVSSNNETANIILLDATFNTDDEHGSHYQDIRFHSDTIEWLRTVLMTDNKETFYIGTHVAPHQSGSYFNNAQMVQIGEMLNSVRAQKPNIKTHWFFGHNHVMDVTPINNMGSPNPGYLLPATILLETGRFTELSIVKGNVSIIKRELSY